MEIRSMQIKSRVDNRVAIRVIPGHFATNHSHVNYYIDMTGVKCPMKSAREAAVQLAVHYAAIPVDTIVCMDGCEMIGGFLARELTREGALSINSGNDMNIVTPEFNSNGQLIFRDNVQQMIWNKRVLLLLASATTGKTINRCLECIQYYGGTIAGIAAIFSAIPERQGVPVRALFTRDDIPDYQTHAFADCPACREHRKIDAIVNSYGYSKI